jgi:parallel beta-helix repeat protein
MAGTAGGSSFSRVGDCLFVGNTASDRGGGAGWGMLNNCTLSGNQASGSGGGAYGSAMNNCILYYNSAPTDANYGTICDGCYPVNNACSIPLISGTGNITNAPLFVNQVAGDYHLGSNSPCINAGNNAGASSATDFDGNPRIVGGTVDIGAYEFQSPVSQISYAWLQQYDLPINTNTDFSDADGDGMNNWQEWRTGTIPTNSSSLLQMMSPAFTNNPSGVTVSWQSVSGVNYFIQRCSDLLAQPAFSTIQTDIAGQTSTTSYTDSTATNGGPYFYRVGVQ